MRFTAARTTLSAIALAAALMAPPAATPAAAQSSEALSHSAIAGQIEAFRAQDGERAYSYAAPGVKRFFRSPGAFMTMVQRGYKPVYAPRDYSFGRFGERNGQVFQEVLITGPEGKEWAALYTLEAQDDGSMLITSVRLVRARAAAI